MDAAKFAGKFALSSATLIPQVLVGGAKGLYDVYNGNHKSNYKKGVGSTFRFEEEISNLASKIKGNPKVKAVIDSVLGGGAVEDIIQRDADLKINSNNQGGGDAVGTLATVSPLTSGKNEMNRSVIVNMNSLVENVNINGGLSSSETTSQIETQVAEVFTKVVADWEIGMSR